MLDAGEAAGPRDADVWQAASVIAITSAAAARKVHCAMASSPLVHVARESSADSSDTGIPGSLK